MPIPPETKLDQPGRLAALWVGLLTGPLVWLLVLQVSYALVATDCRMAHRGVLLAVMLVGLLLTAGAAGLSWNVWKQVRGSEPREAPRSLHRTRFLALSGLITSAFFVLVLLGTALPIFMLRPCD